MFKRKLCFVIFVSKVILTFLFVRTKNGKQFYIQAYRVYMRIYYDLDTCLEFNLIKPINPN